jgi:aerobic C4-dicarboxylate transport protein
MHRHLNNETDEEADSPESVLVTEEEEAGIGVPQTSGARAY